MAELVIPTRPSRKGEPVWELLELVPQQGMWSEADYLALDTNRIVELVDGRLEVPPVPDAVHQMLVWLITSLLNHHSINGQFGKALCASFKLKIPNGNWREPDVSYLLPKNLYRQRREWWDYADLAVEIVSPDRPERDYEEKRLEYARVGVPEYWIIDPQRSRMTVLVLSRDGYREDQVAVEGHIARSVVIPGLTVDVGAILAKARE